MVGITYRELYPVRVNGTKPGEYNVWVIVKVVFYSEFDGYEKKQRVDQERKQSQLTRTRRKSEDDGEQP